MGGEERVPFKPAENKVIKPFKKGRKRQVELAGASAQHCSGQRGPFRKLIITHSLNTRGKYFGFRSNYCFSDLLLLTSEACFSIMNLFAAIQAQILCLYFSCFSSSCDFHKRCTKFRLTQTFHCTKFPFGEILQSHLLFLTLSPISRWANFPLHSGDISLYTSVKTNFPHFPFLKKICSAPKKVSVQNHLTIFKAEKFLFHSETALLLTVNFFSLQPPFQPTHPICLTFAALSRFH